MARTKRPLSEHIYDHFYNKKRKLQNENTDRSRFEDLPIEIFYEIIEYLDFYHVYKAFFHVTTRFQYILTNFNLPIKINTLPMSKQDFESFNNDIIIQNEHRINILRLSNPFMINKIFSPPRFVLNFHQLETLSLENIKSASLKNILNYLIFLPKLQSLTIKPIDPIERPTLFYLQIFQLEKLKFCQLDYEIKRNTQEHLTLFSGRYSPIENLIINTDFPSYSIDTLLSYVPRLRRLTLNCLVETYGRKANVRPIVLRNFEYLSLNTRSIEFKEFEIYMKYFFRNVQVLRITTQADTSYYDAKRWEGLILNYLPNLKIFDLNHDATCQISYTPIVLTFHQSIEQFNSPFWFKRNWFFTHQHATKTTTNCGILNSVKPYRRKLYKYHWDLNGPDCLLGDRKTNLNSVKHVDICSSHITDNCIYYFPNATELTIRHNFTSPGNSMEAALNRILPLEKVQKLKIKYYGFPFEQLVRLLRFTPNLHTLELLSLSFIRTNISLMQQREIFQYVSKSNQIKNLDFREHCSLEYIEMITTLFPRLEYLKTGLNKKEIGQNIRFLFSQLKKKMNHFFFLCISYTPKVYLRELKVLIKLQNLFQDCFVDLVDYNLCIWW